MPIASSPPCGNSSAGMMRRSRGEAEISMAKSDMTRCDALVSFGISSDLANKKIFPALYAMAKKKALTVPLIGVATPTGEPGAIAQSRDG